MWGVRVHRGACERLYWCIIAALLKGWVLTSFPNPGAGYSIQPVPGNIAGAACPQLRNHRWLKQCSVFFHQKQSSQLKQSQCREGFETTPSAPGVQHRSLQALPRQVMPCSGDWGQHLPCGALRRMGTEVAAGWVTLHLAHEPGPRWGCLGWCPERIMAQAHCWRCGYSRAPCSCSLTWHRLEPFALAWSCKGEWATRFSSLTFSIVFEQIQGTYWKRFWGNLKGL